jgi:hypothetical protein
MHYVENEKTNIAQGNVTHMGKQEVYCIRIQAFMATESIVFSGMELISKLTWLIIQEYFNVRSALSFIY